MPKLEIEIPETPFSFKEIIKHVLYGRIPHVAIVVKDSPDFCQNLGYL